MHKDPFETPKEGLNVANGKINGVKARILIDPGSVISHIDKVFCEKNKIETKNKYYYNNY